MIQKKKKLFETPLENPLVNVLPTPALPAAGLWYVGGGRSVLKVSPYLKTLPEKSTACTPVCVRFGWKAIIVSVKDVPSVLNRQSTE